MCFPTCKGKQHVIIVINVQIGIGWKRMKIVGSGRKMETKLPRFQFQICCFGAFPVDLEKSQNQVG